MLPDGGSALRVGNPVRCRFSKWPGLEHWQHDCVWLGSDGHGDWLGQRAGARSWRPGAAFNNPVPNVTLLPRRSTGWVATLFPVGHPSGTRVYIDLMWDVAWHPAEPGVVTGIDMDLDVVRVDPDRVFLDDEDEFVEHALAWDYPDDVQARVREVAGELLQAVSARTAPFDETTATYWLARLAAAQPRASRW